MPLAFASSMTSWSRMEPPGCTMAVAPASAACSNPSLNGKNASEATQSFARPGSPGSDFHRFNAAGLSGPDAHGRCSLNHDNGVGFDLLTTRTANFMLSICSRVGWRSVTVVAFSQSMTGGSSVCTNTPPSIGFLTTCRSRGLRRSLRNQWSITDDSFSPSGWSLLPRYNRAPS